MAGERAFEPVSMLFASWFCVGPKPVDDRGAKLAQPRAKAAICFLVRIEHKKLIVMNGQHDPAPPAQRKRLGNGVFNPSR